MSKKRAVIGGVVVLVVLAAIAASGGSGNAPAGTVATQSPGAFAAAQSSGATDTPSAAPPSATSAGAYKVGDRIKVGDEEYFTVSQVVPAFPGNDVFKPAADKRWVAALVEIEGINPSGATYNPFYFKVRDEQGFEYNFAPFGKEPSLQSGNDLMPGHMVKGWMTFEVPATAKTLTLVYTPGFLGETVEVVLK